MRRAMIQTAFEGFKSDNLFIRWRLLYARICFCLFSFSRWITFPWSLNDSSLDGRIGSIDRIFRLNINFAGLYPFSSAVALYVNSTCTLLLFLIMLLDIFTATSAKPLFYWYLGELVMCSNWYFFANFQNSDLNCFPQSDLTTLGMSSAQRFPDTSLC